MIDLKRIKIKYRAGKNYLLWHHSYPITKSVRVSEFPKSGGTWLCQLLSATCGLDFPRNQVLPTQQIIHHAHYKGPTDHPTIILIRNGRDIMVSAYFHFLFYNEDKPKFLVDQWRKQVPAKDYEDVTNVLPKFIKAFNEHFKVAGQNVTWSDHVMSYHDQHDHHYFVKYEDLLSAPQQTLAKTLEWLGYESVRNISEVIEEYSFVNQARRSAGNEKRTSFLRKGISGDWKNYFTEEAIDIFNNYNSEAYKYWKYD